MQDLLQHPFGPAQNIVVPEPNNPPAVTFEPRRPPRIVSAVSMLAAVEFDDQASLNADKIRNESTNWVLATELVAVQLPIAHQRPKTPFGVGHVGT